MSVRAITTRLFKHGTRALRSLYERKYNASTITETVIATTKAGAPTGHPNINQILPRAYGLKDVGLQVGVHARRLFVDNVLNRVTNSLSADLRRKATRRLLFGDSAPFFALIGVGLASGAGILTKDDELEGVCWEIREAVSKIKWNIDGFNINESRFENEEITLKDLTLGQAIAKGCSAVVYSAKINDPSEFQVNIDPNIQATVNETENAMTVHMQIPDSITNYPFALKMMFNYDIQSSAIAILRAMHRETVPARQYYNTEGISEWENQLTKRKRNLPAHPNIVAMYSVFADYVPNLKDSLTLFPDALPSRINPEGYGRNMSLFLLMKRYDCSLKQYVTTNEVNIRKSILMLGQLLEGVVHMNIHGVAHRDLKSDNILLDLNDEDNTPILVVTDFGCCLADNVNGLYLPYNSMEIDKGGNAALMAPEVILQTPGTFSNINYTKSDLWATGTIAYEIFGQNNPFYASNKSKSQLRNIDYDEMDLPELPKDVPKLIRLLVKNILSRNPSRRLDPEVAANVCQLFLWAPSAWIKENDAEIPSSTEILQWLLCLTTKILCESRLSKIIDEKHATKTSEDNDPYKNTCNAYRGRRTYPEYLLISSFLGRARLSRIRKALYWIQENN